MELTSETAALEQEIQRLQTATLENEAIQQMLKQVNIKV